MTPRARGAASALLALAMFAAWWWVSTARLDAQGPYYDELHQATGAFTCTGSAPEYFARWTVHGIPLLNMPYSGALKTAVYGGYLRLTGNGFSLRSWRLAGILLAAGGAVAFMLLASPALSPAALAVFVLLLVTDGTAVIASRHDWGPVALGLAFRLLLLGAWLRDTARPTAGPGLPFLMGLVSGLAIFEKLSSVVILIPLAFALFSRRRPVRHHFIALAGLVIGLAPLALANVLSWRGTHTLVSLSDMGSAPRRTWAGVAHFATSYAALGSGGEARRFVLGTWPPALAGRLEPWFLVGTTGLAAVFAASTPRADRKRTAALALVASWALIGIAFLFFPRPTWIHHWIAGTPLQYAAIALGLDVVRRLRPGFRSRALVACIVMFTALRLTSGVSLHGAFARGEASRHFHPDLSRLGEFAAAQGPGCAFVAADWGVGTPIYCYANGRRAFVKDFLWEYAGPASIEAWRRTSGAHRMFVVALNPPTALRPTTVARVFHDFETSAEWREVPLEGNGTALTAVTVRAFDHRETAMPPTNLPHRSAGPR